MVPSMTARVPLIFFERIATWARRIRPRVVDWPVWVVETRSAGDLTEALRGWPCPLLVADELRGWPCPLLVADLGDEPSRVVEVLAKVLHGSPDALVLAIDPNRVEGVAEVARVIGVARVLGGVVTPPEVMAVLDRWLPIARERTGRAGWSREGPRPRIGEPGWDPMDLIA